MSTARRPLTRRIEVAEEPLLAGAAYDYADAFEVQLPEPDGRTAEEWARCGLEQSPWVMRRAILLIHRHVLGLRLGPVTSPDHVLGWTIRSSRPDVVHLEASSRLGRGVLVGRRRDATSTELATFLYMDKPRTFRVIWAVVGPVHRLVAPYLLARAATAARRPQHA